MTNPWRWWQLRKQRRRAARIIAAAEAQRDQYLMEVAARAWETGKAQVGTVADDGSLTIQEVKPVHVSHRQGELMSRVCKNHCIHQPEATRDGRCEFIIGVIRDPLHGDIPSRCGHVCIFEPVSPPETPAERKGLMLCCMLTAERYGDSQGRFAREIPKGTTITCNRCSQEIVSHGGQSWSAK